MRVAVRRAGRVARILLAGLALCTATAAVASDVVFGTATLRRELNGSKFRHVGALNAALAQALARCGAPAPKEMAESPGELSAATAVAIRRLRVCPGWGIDGEAGSGDVTQALWRKLLPDVPLPDAFARMFITTQTLEGTDYDRLEWNYSAVDPTAWGTWGPYGATFGQSAEIQKILAAIEAGSPGLVEDAFRRARRDSSDVGQTPSPAGRKLSCDASVNGPADDYALFKQVMPLRGDAAGRILRAAFCDDRRFAIWVRAFHILGGHGAVRRAYDAYYLGPDGKVARYLANTRRGYAAAGAAATEIDLAMGMDGQTQLSRRADADAIAHAVRSAGARATPALRRIAISEALPARGSSHRDRCGRDQVFIRGAGRFGRPSRSAPA